MRLASPLDALQVHSQLIIQLGTLTLNGSADHDKLCIIVRDASVHIGQAKIASRVQHVLLYVWITDLPPFITLQCRVEAIKFLKEIGSEIAAVELLDICTVRAGKRRGK